MKAVILAGGFGTRISEESHLRPNDRDRWEADSMARHEMVQQVRHQ